MSTPAPALQQLPLRTLQDRLVLARLSLGLPAIEGRRAALAELDRISAEIKRRGYVVP